MKNIIRILAMLLIVVNANGQFTINNDNYSLEIGGRMQTYYNYRFYKTVLGTTPDNKKNRFKMQDAQLNFKFKKGKKIEAQIGFDMADIASGEIAGEDAPVNDLWVKYTSDKGLGITAGFQKLPYARSLNVPRAYQPFVQRADYAKGDAYSYRDVGITLEQELFTSKLKIFAGAYTGLGEMSLLGDNDATGKLEYIARLEANYPVKSKNRIVDMVHTPVLLACGGFSFRYNQKAITTGKDYQIKTINGTKYNYEADMQLQYQGFTAMLETHRMMMIPADTIRLMGRPTTYFLANAIGTEMNYYWKQIHTILAVRYDSFDQNDLILNNTQSTVSLAANYLFDDFNSCIKIHYWKRLQQNATTPIWDEDQIRFVYSYIF